MVEARPRAGVRGRGRAAVGVVAGARARGGAARSGDGREGRGAAHRGDVGDEAMGLGEDARDVVGVEADRWGGVVEAESGRTGRRGGGVWSSGRRRTATGGRRDEAARSAPPCPDPIWIGGRQRRGASGRSWSGLGFAGWGIRGGSGPAGPSGSRPQRGRGGLRGRSPVGGVLSFFCFLFSFIISLLFLYCFHLKFLLFSFYKIPS